MPSPTIGFLGLGGYVPKRVMTNDEWAEYVDTSDEWIRERTGIERRRIAADDESTADLAVSAAKVALADAGLEPKDLDEIIVATDTPEVYTPDTASFVQHKLGARDVPAFDLGGRGCAGSVLALDVARHRARDRGRKILVIGVELITRLMNWEDRNTCVLFGDGAGASIVGPGTSEILAATAGTDGSQAQILGLETGGTRLPFTLDGAQKGLHKNLVMQGREVFKHATHRMSVAAEQVLTEAGLSMQEVDLVVPHQANLRIIEAMRKRLGLEQEKVFVNLNEYGNTGSASVPLALWEAREQGRVGAGDLVLLTAFGAGFHWAAMLVRL